jgi:adenylosuccinate lyase
VLAELFLLCHGALAAMLPVVAGLEVDAAAMLDNLRGAGVGEDTGDSAQLVAGFLASLGLED